MTGIYQAHSGIRYLVLLLGIVAIVLYLFKFIGRRPATKGDRILMSVFVGAFDLQVLLGVVLVAAGIFYGALMGHLMMMLLALVSVHAASVMARRATDDRRAHGLRLGGVLLAFLLILGGIMAIGRSPFGSGPPSVEAEG